MSYACTPIGFQFICLRMHLPICIGRTKWVRLADDLNFDLYLRYGLYYEHPEKLYWGLFSGFGLFSGKYGILYIYRVSCQIW